MTVVLGNDLHWDDDQSRKFLQDARALLNIEPMDFQSEEVTIFHRCDDQDLLAQVVTKMRSYGATSVTLHDQRTP